MKGNLPYESLEKLPNTNRILIDASSVIRACCYAGKDEEFGKSVKLDDGKTEFVNSGYYGSELFLHSYAGVIKLYGYKPYQTVLVLDGFDANRLRKNMYAGYKAGRKKLSPERYESFKVAIKRTSDTLLSLGAMVVQQDMTEADDIIAYLCGTLKGKKLVWSRDADMLALQKEGEVDVLLNETFNPQLSPACDNKQIPIYKALVGDTSDCLPGAKGFGKKAFEDMVLKYGDEGLAEMQEMLESETLNLLDPDDFKPFKHILADPEGVYNSYRCAKFYPQYVNLAYTPMRIEAGIVQKLSDDTHPRLTEYAGRVVLSSTKQDLEVLKSQIKRSPFIALDLETTTPPESREWVAAIRETKKESGKKSNIIDVFGSTITGVGITCGDNLQITYYTPIDHKECHNFSLDDLADVIDAIPDGIPVAVHNSSFELPVLYNNLGGWLSCAVDTQIMKSYVDENTKLGLKACAQQYFNYTQTSYEGVTQGRTMDELTAAEVLDYGADDTIVTAALYNRLKFTLELENTLPVFEACELLTQYWASEAFVNGFPPNLACLKGLEAKDQQEFLRLEEELFDYLRSINWPGCKFVPLEDAALGKEAFLRLTGEPLKCRARLVEKVAEAIREQGQPELADLYEAQDIDSINKTLEACFEPSPEFDVEKTKHIKTLVYDTWKLPIRFRTIPTKIMRSKGITQGNPQVDNPAIAHMLALDLDPAMVEHRALNVIKEMKAINTRQGLYYTPYPTLTHWKDGRIHPNLGQSLAVTRRFTPSQPNVNQLPKKEEGLAVRGVVQAPEGWFVCAMDWSGQELRLAADASQDENMLSCYIGEHLRDPHSLVGASIAKGQGSEFGDYEKFVANLKNPEVLAFRITAKGVNFSSQYLCRAPKLAKLLVTDNASAQTYLEAKDATYPGLAVWQQRVIDQARELGYAVTRLGARRHLQDSIRSSDKYKAAEAERRAVNFEIQGSAAEMIKLAVNEMVRTGYFHGGGAQIIFPVHDELVSFISKEAIHEALPVLHGCMTKKYADMTVPLESDIALGHDFGSLVSVGNGATDDNINKATDYLKENKQ
jgi:DNA polymerase I-like protein with 3'-5' exonuclease and polymerase domains/5'-3' exonuclease